MKKLTPSLKRIYLNLRVLMRYGTTQPHVVQLPRCSHRVSVDPDDPRARKKLIADGARGKVARNQQFWREACRQLRPSIAIDVGVNYGECLFSADYDSTMRVIGIEANPELAAHLEASRKMHQDRHRIELHNALADECSGGWTDFFIDRDSSGGSTAGKGLSEQYPERYTQIAVPRVCLDELLQPSLEERLPGPILFKIDVEGFEFHVLKGMTQTFLANIDMIGLIEFDTRLLRAADTDPAELWSFIQEHFETHVFCGKFRMTCTSGMQFDELQPLLASQKNHTDVILVRRCQRLDWLRNFLQQWEAPKPLAA